MAVSTPLVYPVGDFSSGGIRSSGRESGSEASCAPTIPHRGNAKKVGGRPGAPHAVSGLFTGRNSENICPGGVGGGTFPARENMPAKWLGDEGNAGIWSASARISRSKNFEHL